MTKSTRHQPPGLVRLLRPRHWVKNGFVLAPLVFSGSFLEFQAVGRALIATLLFCIGASATYVFNDLRDVASDRQHDEKRISRPIALGEVSPRQAWILLGTLLFALLLAGLTQPRTAGVVLLYLLLTTSYSLKLKEVPVVDLFSLAIGFVMRVWAGAVAIEVHLSAWMFITTLSLALYLATLKRQVELQANPGSGRVVLQLYSPQLLDRYASLAAVSATLFYGLFVVTVRQELIVTLPLVLFGLFRYWYLADTRGRESPTDLLWSDLMLIGTVLSWGLLCAYLLWP